MNESPIDPLPGINPLPRRSMARRLARIIVLAPVWTVLVLWSLWAAGALFHDLPPAWPSGALACLHAVLVIDVVIFLRRFQRMVAVALACVLVNGWWLTIAPSNERDWQPLVATTAHAVIDGDSITIHGVRNTDYRSLTDFTPHFSTRTVHLSKLTRVDLFLCYWGSPWLAHPFVSFQFEDADPVCFSVETRMEKGEAYSSLGGLYRRYELIYVVAEERDLVRLRSKYREGEDVYLFRIKAPADRARSLFLDYLVSVNELHEQPHFYNLLTDNCTTSVELHLAAVSRRPRLWDWRILLPGKLDELIHIRGGFVSDLPLPELKKLSWVNAAANRVGAGEDFSRLIREGLPSFDDE